MSPGNPVYLLTSTESNARILQPGRVAICKQGKVVVEFEDAISQSAGTDVILFFDLRGKFIQQGAAIVAYRAPEAPNNGGEPQKEMFKPSQAVAFQLSGEPISAESRGSFRVSVVAMNLTVRFEKERACTLADISPEGLALVTQQRYRPGMIANVSFTYENDLLEGRVRVQTVKPISGGRFRCGLLAPTAEKPLRTGLQKMTAAVQRRHLQRVRQSA